MRAVCARLPERSTAGLNDAMRRQWRGDAAQADRPIDDIQSTHGLARFAASPADG
jgi:hypothetical protein